MSCLSYFSRLRSGHIIQFLKFNTIFTFTSRDILDRQQAGAEGAGGGGGGGRGAGQGGQGGQGEGRRVARPRMRGFTLGGFRFRFGIVFHTVHQQVRLVNY